MAVTPAEPRERRLLKNIERLTGQRIAIERVPTVADLRSRRLEQTAALVREHVDSDSLDRYRAVLDILTEETDLIDVTLAALFWSWVATCRLRSIHTSGLPPLWFLFQPLISLMGSMGRNSAVPCGRQPSR